MADYPNYLISAENVTALLDEFEVSIQYGENLTGTEAYVWKNLKRFLRANPIPFKGGLIFIPCWETKNEHTACEWFVDEIGVDYVQFYN